MEILKDQAILSCIGQIKYLQSSSNCILLMSQNQLTALKFDPSFKKETINMNSVNMLKLSVSNWNLIAILYSNGTMEVRKLNSLNQVYMMFTDIAITQGYPKIRWEKQQIYLVHENNIQVVNLLRKQRKVYKEIAGESKDQIEDIVLSSMINRQKIVILQFANKLTLNILPFPITQVNLNKINQIKNLCFHSISTKQLRLDREYLMVLLENKFLHIYNLMDMKLIVRIVYENQQKDQMKAITDIMNQYLLISFSNPRSGKVSKNILYKINSKYYYGSSSTSLYEKQQFFQFQVELEIKHQIYMVYSQNHKENSPIFLFYLLKNRKEIRLVSIEIKENLNKFQNRIEMNPSEKQVRQWKEMIASYLEMKYFDKVNFDLASFQDSKIPQIDKQILVDPQYHKKLGIYDSTEAEKEINQIANFRTNLEEAVIKFYDDGFEEIQTQNPLSLDEEEKKLQQEFFKFMKAYFLEKQIDIDPEKLVQIGLQTPEKRKKNLCIENDDDRIILPMKKNKKEEEKKQIQKIEFTEEQNEFEEQLKSIQMAINKGFAPLQNRIEQMNEKLTKYQGLHVRHLQKCQKMIKKQEKSSQNLTSSIHGYCNEMMMQTNQRFQNFLHSYWGKIEDMDRKAGRERQKTMNEFGKYIDQQIKSRQTIFDSSRSVIDNHLSHLRKKIVETFIEDEEDEIWQQEQQNIRQNLFSYFNSKI